MINYTIVRSKRKTIGLYINKNNEVEIRCPLRTFNFDFDKFVEKHQKWIYEQLSKRKNKRSLTQEEINKTLEYKKLAKEILPNKVEYWSNIIGVKPIKFTITSAKTRWGSCSGKNSISLSWRLMRAKDECIDYVVIHELVHIKQHNHSKKFWVEVEKYCPNYKEYNKQLKELE